MTFAVANMRMVCLMLLEYNMNWLSGDFLLTIPPKSRKAVLLHNENKYSSIPLACSIQIKGNKNFKKLLLKTNYAEFDWYVCGDFKMLGFFGSVGWLHQILVFSLLVEQ